MLICDISVLQKFGMELLDRELLALDLNWQEMVALLVLAQVPEADQAFVGQFLQRDKGNISRTLSSLEKRGLILRRSHPEDRRRKVLVLKEAGQVLVPGLQKIMEEWERRILGLLTPEEGQLYEALSGKVTQGIMALAGDLDSQHRTKGKGGSKA